MRETATVRARPQRALWAHVVPMGVFVILTGSTPLLKGPAGSLWSTAPELWVYPLQTALVSLLLIYFWLWYRLGPLRHPGFTLAVGAIVFLLWISPQQFFRYPPRIAGFNPELLAPYPVLHALTLVARFLRLVIVVPVMEEIFWRGFLLRYLISEDFEAVPFGSFSWLSFSVVTVAFALSHSMADWPAAFITGALYNFVAYRTKSLSSCIAAHGLTNLALGIWIVQTRQWGFW